MPYVERENTLESERNCERARAYFRILLIFIHFNRGYAKIGDLNEKIYHLAGMTERKIVKRIIKQLTEMETQFLKIKMQLNVEEDTRLSSGLSATFDMRP